MTQVEPFNRLAKNLRVLHWRYYQARSAFYIFETLRKLRLPSHTDKNKIHKNLEVLNVYRHFFIPIEEATRCYFFIELAKFFDTDRRAITIERILDNMKQNLSLMTKERFLNFRKSIGSPVLDVLEDNYLPPTLKDLSIINRFIKYNTIVKKLRKYRSQWLAHDDFHKQNIPINSGELKKLFDTIEHVLNNLSLKVDFSTTYYKHVKKECEKDTRSVVDYLIKYNAIKVRERKKKWGV